MKHCAYCGRECAPTKEHIWPSTLIKKYEKLKTFNKRTQSFHGAAPVIKDVCSTCNNEKLSALDGYLSDLFDAHLAKPLLPGEEANLSYDYDLLLRGLLKISYNSARANADKVVANALGKHRNYILDGGHCSGVMLRLQVVTASKILVNGKLTGDLMPVSQLRVGEMAYDGKLYKRFIVRMVGINSFWFYLVISLKPEPRHKWKEFVTHFSNWQTPYGIELQRNKLKVHIPVNQTTYMHPSLLGVLLHAKR